MIIHTATYLYLWFTCSWIHSTPQIRRSLERAKRSIAIRNSKCIHWIICKTKTNRKCLSHKWSHKGTAITSSLCEWISYLNTIKKKMILWISPFCSQAQKLSLFTKNKIALFAASIWFRFSLALSSVYNIHISSRSNILFIYKATNRQTVNSKH